MYGWQDMGQNTPQIIFEGRSHFHRIQHKFLKFLGEGLKQCALSFEWEDASVFSSGAHIPQETGAQGDWLPF